MFTKSLTITEVDDAGIGLAKIAQLSAVDSDGDTYERGAFSWKEGGGQWCSIIPAHDRRAMPLGKAWLYEEGDWALAKIHMNLETQAGRDWHQTLKFDLATGKAVVEWSYGFQVLDADRQQRAGDWQRRLKKLDVDEISPVLRGAGVGTGTVSIKGASLKGDRFAGLIGGLGDLTFALGSDASALSASGRKQLSDIHAAIGSALAVEPTGGTCQSCGAKHGDGACPVDAALADYLIGLSRRNLPSA